ncbi:MAG: hypothetical protein OJF49_004848 [Ktedonobacterales bacterium]|nr:MAG: hypothetical protein OJF49_004848 [Ktedonobacterales bacterium]
MNVYPYSISFDDLSALRLVSMRIQHEHVVSCILKYRYGSWW